MTLPKPAPPYPNDPKRPAETGDRPDKISLSYIERAAREMADRKPRRPPPSLDAPAAAPPPEALRHLEPYAPVVPPAPLQGEPPAATEIVAPTPATIAAPVATAMPVATATTALPRAAPPARPIFDDHFRLTLSPWQSAAAGAAILALVVGAFGMAASGWVAAHNWSCRVGLANASCAPSSDPKPLALPEIPT